MKTLEKTMIEFVMEKEMSTIDYDEFDYYQRQSQNLDLCLDYAKLLYTPLTLGMFIPVDEYGNVLEEPEISFEISKGHYRTNPNYQEDIIAYQKALSNVLFEGFHLQHQTSSFKTVSNGRIQITLDQYGFYLEPHDSVNGERIQTIESLIPYKLKLTDNFTID